MAKRRRKTPRKVRSAGSLAYIINKTIRTPLPGHLPFFWGGFLHESFIHCTIITASSHLHLIFSPSHSWANCTSTVFYCIVHTVDVIGDNLPTIGNFPPSISCSTLLFPRVLPAVSNRIPHDVTLAASFRRIYPSMASPRTRLSLIARHLDPRPPIPINTPYTTERLSGAESIFTQQSRPASSSSKIPKMSTQPEHPALLIPGPIEFDDAVLQSMSHYR